jgi:ribosome-associated protein
VLLDYGFFVVHIFSERARQYYDLERLWRNAERTEFHEPAGPAAARPKAHDEPHNESEGSATQQ